MRRVGLAALVVCSTLGCAGPPAIEGDAQPDRDRDDLGAELGGGATAGAEAKPEAPPVDPKPVVTRDAVLAQARGQIRHGQLTASVREQLVASTNPDHRHAARLLQAVAGDPPAPLLARIGPRDQSGTQALTPAPKKEERRPIPDSDVGPEPGPPSDPPSEQPSEQPADPPSEQPAEQPAVEPLAPPPTPSPDLEIDEPRSPESFPPGSPAHGWFADAPWQPEPKPAQEPVQDLSRWFVKERAVLLRERPPEATQDSLAATSSGPRLVILTSMALVPGTREDGSPHASLEIAGAGSIGIQILPIDDHHLRLSVVGAGAVPSFLSASPSLPNLAVVAVERIGRVIEIEVELGLGWRVGPTYALPNGARVEFEHPVPEAETEAALAADLELEPDPEP